MDQPKWRVRFADGTHHDVFANDIDGAIVKAVDHIRFSANLRKLEPPDPQGLLMTIVSVREMIVLTHRGTTMWSLAE